jgi:hypothetical protein
MLDCGAGVCGARCSDVSWGSGGRWLGRAVGRCAGRDRSGRSGTVRQDPVQTQRTWGQTISKEHIVKQAVFTEGVRTRRTETGRDGLVTLGTRR